MIIYEFLKIVRLQCHQFPRAKSFSFLKMNGFGTKCVMNSVFVNKKLAKHPYTIVQ